MKVLQIAYYYPPMGGAGVQRALKFSKYLPLFGIEPVVLCALDPHYVHDPSLTAEVPVALEVHRVEHRSILSRLLARRRVGAETTRAFATSASAPSAVSRRARDTVLAMWQILQYPDDKAAWARRALAEGRRIIRAHASSGAPIEAIFSSAPPVSAHNIGERLAREFGLPWIADFRDLWTDNPAYHASRWRRRLDHRLEQRWLDRAEGVITVTASWRDMLQTRRTAGAPVAFIPNGYDEEDFRNVVLPERPIEEAFTLVHTGTFYGSRDPAGLLSGLSRYLAGSQDGMPPLRVRLIGNMGSRFLAQLRHFDERHPGVVECIGYLPHARALGELVAADALLLVVGGGRGPALRGWLPGKIFEYLHTSKPILMLGDDRGDAAQLVRRHARGWVVDDQDAEGVASALRAMLGAMAARAGIQSIANRAPAESPERFERRELSKQLADFIRQCVANRSHTRKGAGDV